jgi:lipopolysaccharide transport system ATP-binding protein
LVKVEGVSKKFSKDLKRSLRYGLADIMRGVFKNEMKTELRKDEFWAVQDVSFEVRRGECLGLIGHNGAGKSTLLKMLNGLISPDKGRIEMRGRVGALIELGAGFNPVLTGRENIYNNGAVLGFSKAEIDAKMAEIIEFSEITDYLDMPVQNYSSGMKVRLGFAVAAQMQPDILIVDEVLAVGDMGFTVKCFNIMDKLLKNTALIVVSHSIPQISRISTSILMLDKGKKIIQSQDISEGIKIYYDSFKNELSDYTSSHIAELVNVEVYSFYEKNKELKYGEPFNVEIKIKCNRKILNPNIYLVFYDKEQRAVAEIFNFSDSININSVENYLHVKLLISNFYLSQGKYSLTVGFFEKDEYREMLFRAQSVVYFNVIGGYIGWIPVQLNPKWELIK